MIKLAATKLATEAAGRRLIIRIPEGIEFSLALAGPMTRFLAWTIDAAAIGVASSMLGKLLTLLSLLSVDLAIATSTLPPLLRPLDRLRNRARMALARPDSRKTRLGPACDGRSWTQASRQSGGDPQMCCAPSIHYL